MREYGFTAITSDDEAIIKVLDALTTGERDAYIRKALHAFIRQNPSTTVKNKEVSFAVRPEPHGYPVE